MQGRSVWVHLLDSRRGERCLFSAGTVWKGIIGHTMRQCRRLFFFFFFNQFASLSLQPRGYNPGYDNMTMTGSVANAPGVLCDS